MGRETSDPTRPTWTNVPSTSLLNPNPDQPLSGVETITSVVHTTAIANAAYLLDTMHLANIGICPEASAWIALTPIIRKPLRQPRHLIESTKCPVGAPPQFISPSPSAAFISRRAHLSILRPSTVAQRQHRESAAGKKQDL